ncbi:MAG: hypothetical protein EXR66_01525 [Dehalococcoidia bacterium]|nr:hypothetical protein [Dehalococcoidia bacterium]
MPDPQDRLEREIEEILGKIEDFPSASERWARARKKATGRLGTAIAGQQRAVLARLSRIDMSQVMLLSFVLILGSLFLGRMLSPLITQWVLYAGVALFIASFAVLVFAPKGGRCGPPGSAPYWRGRQIDYRSPSIADRAKRWWGGRGRKS